MARAEIHFHLLPGVDDGPESIEESVAIARAARAEGTETIVATPHVRSDFITDVSDLPDRVREVRERLDREGLGVEVVCGAELGHDMVGRLSQPELATIAAGRQGARWLLVESPFGGLDADFADATDELRDRGFGIVLAHPERTPGLLTAGAGLLRREVEQGTVLQVNAGSLCGDNGPAARALALLLVADGRARAVASDAHSPARGPCLSRAVDAARAARMPERLARRSVDVAPRRLLERGIAPPLPSLAA